ncbi:phage tail protein [Leptothoe spongobia]|nr:phage tail protein [Leptothoe spongobia]
MSLTQSVQLQLTPMQLLNTTAAEDLSFASATVSLPQQQLRLNPDEPSELLIQVKNISQRPLQLRLNVTGDFPAKWCYMGIEEPTISTTGLLLKNGPGQFPVTWCMRDAIAPHQNLDISLYFKPAADFFEAAHALGPNDTLKLNYQGQIQVYAGPDGADCLMGVENFSLHIRPDSRYLKFLPAVYQEVDFISRFLKLFEQSFDPAVQAISWMWAYLDPLTAPEAMLPFLAQWVGWPSDIYWSQAQQRRLIRRAFEIYQWRGTKQGLRLYLHLYTGLPLDLPDTPESQKHISIQEVFSRGFVMDEARLDHDAILGGGKPFHFTVRLRTEEPEKLDEALIHTIIDQEKPAFCTYDLLLGPISPPVSPTPPTH